MPAITSQAAQKNLNAAPAANDAFCDPLTGLPDGRWFERAFRSRLGPADSTEDASGVLIKIDIDTLASLNHAFGYAVGDAALKRLAEALRGECAADGFVVRLGGGAFLVFLAAGAQSDDAARLLDRVRRRLSMREGPWRPQAIAFSAGVAYAERLRETGLDLLQEADAALAEAKRLGRGQTAYVSIPPGAAESPIQAADLFNALARGEFEPFFHPQVSVETGVVVGMEILARWRHPERGLLGPGAFMPLAESLRMVCDIDRMIMAKTHEILLRWREQGLRPPQVSFNVTSERMRDPELLTSVGAIINDGFEVALELLESTFFENEKDQFWECLSALRATGAKIEIDDFGSGQASIVAMLKIQPDTIKIDQRIAGVIDTDPVYDQIVKSIIDIAQSLGVRVLAEGVETWRQAVLLSEAGCEALQGYLFFRPLDEASLINLKVISR